MSEDVNAELSSIANAFPGNTTSVPDFVEDDELFGTAFEIYQTGYPANEFTGLPVAEQLMRDFDEEFQQALDGQQSVEERSQNGPGSLGWRSSRPPARNPSGRARQRTAWRGRPPGGDPCHDADHRPPRRAADAAEPPAPAPTPHGAHDRRRRGR